VTDRDRSERERTGDATAGSDDRTDVERCTNCGDRIETSEWHPVRTVRGPDGELALVQFCTETCCDAWSRD
jgi:hypothetical protein